MKPARTKSLVPWILVAVIALIAYGSLYPFNFKREAFDGGMLDALRQLSWVRAGRGDRVANVLLYVPLGFCLYLWLETGRRRWLTTLLVVACGASLSLLIEVAQVFVSSRVPSLMDLTLNSVGTLAGAVAGVGWRLLSRLMLMPTVGGNRNDRIALAVILLWLGWRFAPFVPQVSLAKLKLALSPLFSPHFEYTATLGYLACWMVVGQALFTLVARPVGIEALLALIAGVLVGRLLLEGQVFVASELLALLLLLPALVILNRLAPALRRLLLLAALSGVFFAARLTPFEFTASAAAFDLWPFLGWIAEGMDVDTRRLLEFLFFCCALIWLVREAGASLDAAIAVVVACVCMVELVQVWQPRQTASITDPLLALGLGLLLRLVAPRGRKRLSYG